MCVRLLLEEDKHYKIIFKELEAAPCNTSDDTEGGFMHRRYGVYCNTNEDMDKWLEENEISYSIDIDQDMNVFIEFDNKSDATLFKLKWF